MLELLITGGRILDGSGNPAFHGALGVDDDRRLHVLRGDIGDVQAAKVLNATGKIVCPGFIDLHAHSALMLLAEPKNEAKVLQGITTELLGIDGNSYAPFTNHEDLVKFIRLNSGLEGAPDITPTWLSVAEYLAQYDSRIAGNIAYIIGNAAVRISAMGWKNCPPTARQLDDMVALMRTGMEEGAYGISTGLDYPPGSYADTDELIALSKVTGRFGGFYHTHVRNSLGDRFLDPFREALEIGRRADIPIHLTHFFQRAGSGARRGGARRLLGLVDDARNEGLDVTFDSHPYNLSSTRLLIMVPQWAHDGGPDALLDVLASKEGRKRLERELVPPNQNWYSVFLTYFKQPHNQKWEGRCVAEIAELTKRTPVETVCDLLIEEDLQLSYVAPHAAGNPNTIPHFLQHPVATFATDGLLIGDYPNPRGYGMMPFILGEWVMEEGLLGLSDAVRKMTWAPAQRIGLRNRGLLHDGFHADIVVFDPQTVMGTATQRHPKRPPVGIDYVIVNGTIVADHGVHTGALPGRALRRGRD